MNYFPPQIVAMVVQPYEYAKSALESGSVKWA